ncbi:MAG: hypothetical protein AB1505_10640 [Candidatus Latescibacterota bacterium]
MRSGPLAQVVVAAGDDVVVQSAVERLRRGGLVSPAESPVAAGHAAFAFDPRGTGEMTGCGVARNWAWLAGRPTVGMWALDIVQAARVCRRRLEARAVRVEACGPFGWPALLGGAALPGAVDAGVVLVPWATQRQRLAAEGDAAVADVPGLLERLDVPQLRALWPQVEVRVDRD